MKKRGGWLLAALFIVGLVSFAPSALAESSGTYERNYESNGVVGFYGKYVSPDVEEQTKDVPSNSKEPETSAPMKNGVSHETHYVSTSPSTSVDKIPQTGDESPWKSWGISLLFMMGAILFLSKYKTQTSKEEIV